MRALVTRVDVTIYFIPIGCNETRGPIYKISYDNLAIILR